MGGNWNVNNSSAHGVVGYFTAQTANNDDLVLYANGATINHSNFSITETNSLGEGMTNSDLLKGTGAFSSSSGWTTNTWTITGGYAQGGSGNDSVFRQITNLIVGRTYCISCNVLQLHNSSTLYFYIPHNYGAHPIQHTGYAFGYFVGGFSPTMSRVQRVDYSNDGVTTSPKGNLSAAAYRLSAAGNSNFGYVTGGNSPRTTVQRIDYSNDTATAAVKGPLSNPQSYVMATGNASYGYWSGGQTGSTPKSTVDRIDYSNDSANMVSKGPLSESGFYFVGISSPAYGYTCGSLYPSYKSTVQRADYANDTATAVVKGPLSRSDGSGSGLNSRSYGYVAGGQNPGNNSYVDRIDFSNDSATASPKGH